MNGQTEVYDCLKEYQIPFRYVEHPAAHSGEELIPFFRGDEVIPCKNLFFRNKKGNQHYLVILEASKLLDIRVLERMLKQGRLSFASSERMMQYLGLSPGSVSLFGLVHDTERHVIVYIDESLLTDKHLCFHPNLNTASLVIRVEDMLKFIELRGNRFAYLPLTEGR